MKVYTKTGDRGTTSLVGGTRVSKDSPRLQAYGTIDELNSWLGLILASAKVLPAEDRDFIQWIQNKLFNLGSELATEPESRWHPVQIDDSDVICVESVIDRVDATLPAHNRFILPGGTVSSAQAQIARTVARRAERLMVALDSDPATPVGEAAMRFINRLSDYLFILARQFNALAGVEDVFWDQNA